MSVSLNYNQMPMSEKFTMLEKLWENMSHDAVHKGFSPQWHLEVLEQREHNLQNGKSTFTNLENVKSRLF